MVRNLSFFLVFFAVFLFLGSCQNKDIDMAKFDIVEERVRPSTDTVGIEGTYDFAREARSMKIHMGLDSTLSDASSHAVTLLGKDYSVTVRGLQPGTTYYYRYSADFGMHSDLVSETRHFVTSEQQSYRISVSSDPGWGGEVTGGGTYEEGQTCTVSASPSEGYVFAFWKESEIPVTQEPSYTFEVTESRILVARFAEIAALPVVITGEVSEIGGVSAMGSGEVTGEGGSEVTERGVCWATGHVPTTSDSHAGNGSGTGAFMAEMTGLSLGTTYRVRAYAVNSEGTAYGEEKSFTTLDHQEYTVSVSASPSSGGTVEGGGSYEEGASCTVRATATNGYTFSNWTEDGNPVSPQANYTFDVTANRNLVANFTQQITVPTVITTPVTNITETSATGGGNVTSDGGATVTERGICWSTSHNPTTSGSHVTSGSGLGSYTCPMTNLTPNTTYYMRAYVTNSQGTAYGNEVSFVTTELPMYTINVSANPSNAGSVNGGGSYQQGQSCTVTAAANNDFTFTNWTEDGNPLSTQASYTFTVTSNRTLVANFTQQISVPTVTTTPVTNITETSATGGGEVTSDGGATVTERGICWSTSHNPTTSGSHGTSGSGLGSYTCLMTNLTPNTTYYMRAYAINSQGTAYGNEISFVTTELPMYTINVSANPSNAGSVNGGGSYQQGQNCTVTAAANNGFTFTNWTEDGNLVSTLASYTFTVTSNRTLVANFTQQITLPTVMTSQVTNVTETSATGGGNVTADGGATVTARGICWSISHNPTTSDSHGTSGSGMGSYTCLMTNLTPNTTYYVRAYATNSQGTAYGNEVSFITTQLPIYTINVSASPTAGGSVSGSGTYQQGQSCTVTATANNWYEFVNWTENGSQVSTNASYTFTVTANRNLVANFTQQVTLPTVTTSQVTNITETAATGGGNVTDDGGATVTQRGVCWSTSHNPTTSNNHGTSGTGTGSFTCLMTGLTPNTTYYVRAYATNSQGTAYGNEVSFMTTQLPTYTITVSAIPTSGGTVTGNGTYQQGQSCTVTATANNGYDFINWTENGNVVSTNENYTFTVTANRTLVAHFEQQITLPTVTTTPVTNIGETSATGGGNVTDDGGATVTERGLCWSTSHNPSVMGTHMASGSGTGSFTCLMTGLTPNTTYYVRAYATNSPGTAYGSELSFVTTQLPTYTITVSADPTSGGNVSGGGTYQEGQQCTVTAMANTGYNFVNWTENGTQVSTNASYTFTVTGSRNLVAHFSAQSYTISVSADPTSGGSVNGGGNYNYGQTCTVTASASSGYNFVNWTENGSQVSTNANYTFTVTGSRNLVAHFSAQSYTIAVSADPTNGGSVNGGGNYNYGQTCTVTASASSGYNFVNWTENGTQVSTNASYSFTVTGSRNLVAHFSALQPPTGAINGLFTINANGNQVWFSQGNLQYKASTGSWRFAINQYDYIGSANSNISSTYSGWIDLFGWGTSGWNCGNTYYRPWDSSTSCSECYGPSGNYNLTGSYANSDWGYYNAISNGGNNSHFWRTLTIEEWEYVLYGRNTSSGILFAKACVNGVNGVIILPDNWNSGYYNLYNTNSYSATYSSNTLSASQWSNIEQNGAVFLPAAGHRTATSSLGIGTVGTYWSASHANYNNEAMGLYFENLFIVTDESYYRYYGQSVRLVRSVQ